MSDPEFDQLDPDLRKRLERLKEVPEREPGLATQGRSNYLAMVHRMAAEQRVADGLQPTAGSSTPSFRLKEWIGSFLLPYQTRQHFSMVRILVSLAVVLALVFGGLAGTVYAAQDSQPGQALYILKTVSEDTRLKLTSNPEAKFQLALALADRRTLEIDALIQKDEPVPRFVAARLESHILLAFDLAAAQGETGQTQALQQIKAQLKDQERILNQAQVNALEDNDPILVEIRQQVQNQLNLIDSGLEDPLQFQQQLQQQEQNREDAPLNSLSTEEPDVMNGNSQPGAGPGPNEQPGEGQIGPRNPTATSTEGSSNEIEPGTCAPQAECEPPDHGSDGGNQPNNPDSGNSSQGGPQTQAPTSSPSSGGGSSGKKP